MLLNALVIIVLTTKQRLRTPYNILLASLARTDFLVGMLVQPLSVASEIKHILCLGPFWTFDTVTVMIALGISLASIGHLALISVERYVFVKLPLRYDDIVTEKRVITGALTAWAISAFEIIVINFQAFHKHWIRFLFNAAASNRFTVPICSCCLHCCHRLLPYSCLLRSHKTETPSTKWAVTWRRSQAP